MLKKLALVLTILGGLVAGTIPALAQSGNPNFSNNVAGRIVASEYGKWSIQTLGNVTAGAATVNFAPCFIHVGTGNRQVFPFWSQGQQALNVPLQVQDGTLSEAIASESAATFPTTANVPPTEQPYTCSFTATFANSHSAGVTITSGDGGLAEAINDALSLGSGIVTIDSTAGISNSMITSQLVYPNVTIEDLRGPQVQYWTATPAASTFLATPSALTSSTVGQSATIAGSSSWGSTVYACVAYVDAMGNEGACSTTYSFSSTTLEAVTGTAPAASTGAVGYTIYLSLSGGTYAFAYQVPITSAVCTLTKVETTTSACALTNATYGQTGSAWVFTGYPVNTSPIALQLGAASTTSDYVGNSNARTTYAYVPTNRPPLAGVVAVSLPFTAGPATVATTVPQVLGTIALPAGFLDYVGKKIRVCGKEQMTNASATVEQIQLWYDGAGSNAAGVPVEIANIQVGGTGTAVAYNGEFCWTGHTSVAGSGVTAGSIQGDEAWMYLGIASAPVGSFNPGTDTFTAATASLNLAGGSGFTSRVHVVQLHTTGTDVSPKLVGLTIESIN